MQSSHLQFEPPRYFCSTLRCIAQSFGGFCGRFLCGLKCPCQIVDLRGKDGYSAAHSFFKIVEPLKSAAQNEAIKPGTQCARY